jgi:hypothetical protein
MNLLVVGNRVGHKLSCAFLASDLYLFGKTTLYLVPPRPVDELVGVRELGQFDTTNGTLAKHFDLVEALEAEFVIALELNWLDEYFKAYWTRAVAQ